MIEYVKVKKGNEVKSIDKGLLRQYITAGWTRVDEKTTASSLHMSAYTTSNNK